MTGSRKWIIFGIAIVMMVGTAVRLSALSHNHRLGQPGVRVGSRVLYDENHKVAAQESVLVPDEVLGCKAHEVPLTEAEIGALPGDTTFGRAAYRMGNVPVLLSVVLMGTDRTSIHQPQYCLAGQNWHIDKTEHATVSIDRPFHYDLPVLKLSLSRLVRDGNQSRIIHGFYVYWFVSGRHLTADMGTRLLSVGLTMLTTGELERWAYVSYLVPCLPGQEDVTYRRLEEFIRASAPEFQDAPPVAVRR